MNRKNHYNQAALIGLLYGQDDGKNIRYRERLVSCLDLKLLQDIIKKGGDTDEAFYLKKAEKIYFGNFIDDLVEREEKVKEIENSFWEAINKEVVAGRIKEFLTDKSNHNLISRYFSLHSSRNVNNYKDIEQWLALGKDLFTCPILSCLSKRDKSKVISISKRNGEINDKTIEIFNISWPVYMRDIQSKMESEGVLQLWSCSLDDSTYLGRGLVLTPCDLSSVNGVVMNEYPSLKKILPFLYVFFLGNRLIILFPEKALNLIGQAPEINLNGDEKRVLITCLENINYKLASEWIIFGGSNMENQFKIRIKENPEEFLSELIYLKSE